MAILAVLMLIGTVSVMTLQQVTASQNGREDIVVFRQLTGQFQIDISKALGQQPDPDNQANYREFRQLTGQFQKDVTTALRIGDASEVPALLNIYTTKVLEIFLGGPDTIPELVADYKADVGKVLGPC